MRWPQLVVAGVAAVLVAGCAGQAEPADRTASTLPSTHDENAGPETPTPSAPTGPQPIPADAVVAHTLTIPAIGVDTPLEQLDRDGSGELQPPVDWQNAGWYAGGPVPGDRGPSVIAGHVDSPTGPAVFARLDELQPGDQVTVGLDDGSTVTFEVDGARIVPQAEFPTDDVYGPVPDRQLRLITCHNYDEADSRYVDNLVVFATVSVKAPVG